MNLRYAIAVTVGLIPSFAIMAQIPSKRELNKEVVAKTLNNNSIEMAKGLKVEENGLELKDIKITVKGDVKPGDVSVTLQPLPSVVLTKAKFLVQLGCQSNLLEGTDRLDIDCKLIVSGKYELLTGTTIEAIEFDEISIKQLPAWGPFLKKPLNSKLASELKNEKKAEWKKKLDETIRKAIDGYGKGD